jgi:hypothetical protein
MGAKVGHTVSAETRAKISAKLKGRPITPAVLEKRQGRKLTPQHRARIGASLRSPLTSCTVDDCEVPPYAHGFCVRHYTNLKRHGDPLYVRDRSGPNHPNWKGSDIGYVGIHHRLRSRIPEPDICALVDGTCKGRLAWAFRRQDVPQDQWLYEDMHWRGRVRHVPYTTNLADYWRLCGSHHVRYDRDLPTLQQKGP